MNIDPSLRRLLQRFAEEGVEYVLCGGQAVRLNGYLRTTEDIDVLIKSGEQNGKRIIKALNFLPSSAELDLRWFSDRTDGEIENIRVADSLLIDLLFAANGESYEAMQPYVREIDVDGARARVLNIDGLLKTKTDYREKDILDKKFLSAIKLGLSE